MGFRGVKNFYFEKLVACCFRFFLFNCILKTNTKNKGMKFENLTLTHGYLCKNEYPEFVECNKNLVSEIIHLSTKI